MNINVKTRKPYKGFFCFSRVMLLLFQTGNNVLDFGALGSYIALVGEADWDRRHSTYGCITRSDEDLARKWNCDPSTVWRKKNQLKELGVLVKRDDGFYRVKHIELLELPTAMKLSKLVIADSQDLIAKTQELIAESQKNIADMQEGQGQNSTQSFNVSSKDNLSYFQESPRVPEEELDRISKEIDEDWSKK
ncbi:hypothetical protein A2865_03010 [Candidatus Woesebacteria bacterium RIFCSPHIGHO2_01_FULL_39_17]|uniref:Uncharacterized protein n=1 Tax=Candidatus Woesebacteria bacterium GW2011_GWA1_39_21b TaxID=1618551 RepID=A0A0G0NKN8_9BACT|nr:MAG: hypothetical protein UT40_C0018G0031 [Candidatus Woesebacteria bacterium GW2011_GWA1_39_21b]OGM23705.1 MAG: hypothetical protein A2865_03010 [Candidatus Woesebacteria bacterium RIFCSPHIGHO2_01_FULL_39_17]